MRENLAHEKTVPVVDVHVSVGDAKTSPTGTFSSEDSPLRNSFAIHFFIDGASHYTSHNSHLWLSSTSFERPAFRNYPLHFIKWTGQLAGDAACEEDAEEG